MLWMALIVFCVLLHYFEQSKYLQYDRGLIIIGERYRFLSAHFIHLNIEHLLVNLLGVVFILVFFVNHLKMYQWLGLIFFSSLFISFSLFWFNTNVQYYVGLSGVLHALFSAAAIIELRRFPLSGWFLISTLVAKLSWEQFNGAVPGIGSIIEGYVVVDSHLYGALSGLIFIIFLMLKSKIFSASSP